MRRRVGTGRGRTVWWIVAITLVAGLAAYLFRPAGRTAQDVRRSSFRTTPDGVAALARGIDRLGRPTAPRIIPLADAGPVPDALVLLSPPIVPSPAEVHALLERIRAGGTLVYAPVLTPTPYGALRVTPLMDSLGIAFRRPDPSEAADSVAAKWVPHRLNEGLPAPRSLRRVLRRRTADENAEEAEADSEETPAADAAPERPLPPLEKLLVAGAGGRRRRDRGRPDHARRGTGSRPRRRRGALERARGGRPSCDARDSHAPHPHDPGRHGVL